VVIFQGRQLMNRALNSKNTWKHVAITISGADVNQSAANGQPINMLSVYINGIKQRGSMPLENLATGIVAFSGGQGSGQLCEMRIWNYERKENDIRSTLSISIPPGSVDQFPGLRLRWLPLRKGGLINPEGSVLYDVWMRRPVGRRVTTPTMTSSISAKTTEESIYWVENPLDCRWPCALPPSLSNTQRVPWSTNFIEEYLEQREMVELQRVASLPAREVPTPFTF